MDTHYIAIKPVCGIPVWIPDVIWEVLSEDKSVYVTTETRVSVFRDALYSAVHDAMKIGEGPESVCFHARVPITRTHSATFQCRIEIHDDDLWVIPDSVLPETRTAKEHREFAEERAAQLAANAQVNEEDDRDELHREYHDDIRRDCKRLGLL